MNMAVDGSKDRRLADADKELAEVLELLAAMCRNARSNDMPLTATEIAAIRVLRAHGIHDA
jgi:hypothetical protein